MNKILKFFKRRFLCVNGNGTREMINATKLSPRVTRSKFNQKQKENKEGEREIVGDCQQKKSAGKKNSRNNGNSKKKGSSREKKSKNSTAEANSVFASRGSVRSFSPILVRAPKKALPADLSSTRDELLPKSENLTRFDSPKIGTISADTPERNGQFYKNIENISDCRLRILGRGSFGTIIRATYRGELVAAKIVPPSKVNTLKNELNNFFLSHPNVVKTLRIISNEENLSPGLVIMEMCSSFTLEHLAHEETYQLSDKSIVSFMTDTSRALDHCHSQRVLHLDVKPKNILVNITTNVCKLCDFGSSCLLLEEDLSIDHADYKTLQSTAVYTSPELLTGGSPTDKSDVYSFGITLWQLVHREKPYVVDNKIDLQSTIYKIVKQKKRPHKKVKKNDKLEKLYVRCWEHEPDKRPAMKEVIQYLENIPVS